MPATRKRRGRVRLRPSLESLERRALLATFTTYPLPSTDPAPASITSGPDGNLWFTDVPSRIGKITPSGSVTMYTLPSGDTADQITAGSDGNIWFNDPHNNGIGKITTTGQVQEFVLPVGNFLNPLISDPLDVTLGPDGNVWFVGQDGLYEGLGEITPSGQVTGFQLPSLNLIISGGFGPSLGNAIIEADGELWFKYAYGLGPGGIGEFTTSGTLIEHPFPSGTTSAPSVHYGITADANGNIWYLVIVSQAGPNGLPVSESLDIGEVTPSGQITEYPLINGFDVTSLGSGGGLTTGSDGNLYFTYDDQIGQVIPSASGSPTFNRLLDPNTVDIGQEDHDITSGPDGNIWYTEASTIVPQGSPATGAIVKLSISVGTTTPDIAMNSAAITPGGQNVNATYTITGSNLPSPGTIDFYWAKGPDFADKLGSPVSIPTQTAIGSYTANTLISKLGQRPADATYILAVADSSNADPAHKVASVAVPFPPDIAMVSAAITPDGQTVNATYTITGSNLASPGTIDFYWASGPTIADEIPTATTPVKVPTATTARPNPYAVSTSIESLGAQPLNATYILAVADSPSADPAHLVAAVPLAPLPDIVMDMATTKDSRSVTVTYDITTLNITQALTFNIYRSSSDTSYTQSDEIATDTLSASDTADLSVGPHHQITLLSGPLLPDPSHPFVIVVANPGHTIQEQNYSNDSAYFQIFVLGAISHGYIPPPEDKFGTEPAWESLMATSLKRIEHYTYVVEFNWVTASHDRKRDQAAAAGRFMAEQVASYASLWEARHSGNVVDIHFIGHSRGSVVISQAIQDLMAEFPQLIRGSYIKMTMLDPHPARNYSNDQHNYMDYNTVGAVLAAGVRYFQHYAKDPNVVVPAAVDSADVFFQHTPVELFKIVKHGTFNTERILNLWGHGDDGTISDQSNVGIAYHELTSQKYAGIGYIGHSEVYEYYQNYIINTGESLIYN